MKESVEGPCSVLMAKSERRGKFQLELNKPNRISKVKYIYICVKLVIEIQWIGLLSIPNSSEESINLLNRHE